MTILRPASGRVYYIGCVVLDEDEYVGSIRLYAWIYLLPARLFW